jgi:hypothetical protein
VSLTENITVADIYDMQPGQVYAVRLRPPFRRASMRVLMPTDPIMIGALYVMADEAAERAVVRLLGEIPGFYVVDEFQFLPDASWQRGVLPRDRWRAEILIDIE